MKRRSAEKKRLGQGRGDTPLGTLTQCYLAVMCSAALLLPGLSGYQSTGRSAFLFCAGVSTLYLAALVLMGAELSLTGGGRLKNLAAPLAAIRPARICFLLYAGWGLLSALLSPYEGVWLGTARYEGLCFLLLCVAVYWAVSSYGRWDDRFLYLLGVVVGLNALLGVLQYAGWNPLGLFPQGVNYHDAFVLYNGRFLGTLGNVDLLGGFLCLTVPIFYGRYLVTGRKRALLPLGAGAFLLALAQVDAGYLGLAGALFLTIPLFYSRPGLWRRGMGSAGALLLGLGMGKLLYAGRGIPLRLEPSPLNMALLGSGAVLLLAGLLLSRKGAGEPLPPLRRTRAWVLAGAMAVLVLAGMGVLFAVPFSCGTLGEAHQILHGNLDPTFGSGRVRIWSEVLRLIREAPLFGGGPDTLAQRMTFTFTRYSQELGTTIEATVDSAHNEFLNIAVNLGLPALGCYVGGLLCWGYALRRRLSPTVLVLLPGIVGYLVQICFTVGATGVILLFWIFLALCERDINLPICKEENRT